VKISQLSRSRGLAFLVVLLIVFVPGTLVLGTIGADRLGYCVNDIFGASGLNADPYVQNVSATSGTIAWRTMTEQGATIRLNPGDEDEDAREVPPGTIQSVTFDGLSPDRTYAYIVERESASHEGSFTTAPETGGTVEFAVIGDSGTGSSAQYDIARQLETLAPDAVLHTGDVVYRRGALCHFGTKFFGPYGSIIRSVPIFPTAGNHDLMANEGRAYFETFVLPANNPEGSEAYYSFDFGPVHVVSISSEFYAQNDDEQIATQRAWLESDLAETDLPWIVVIVHRPFYASESGKAHDGMRADLEPILIEHGVHLVLAGHAHNYERFEPVEGITHIVTGGGGANVRNATPGDQTAMFVKAHHALHILATPESLSIRAIGRDGIEFDAVEIRANQGET
jgi:acid phosphatase type 7